jgi:hypothetical protein
MTYVALIKEALLGLEDEGASLQDVSSRRRLFTFPLPLAAPSSRAYHFLSLLACDCLFFSGGHGCRSTKLSKRLIRSSSRMERDGRTRSDTLFLSTRCFRT